ncbi:cysteine-rich KTR domain-containing protein [Enterococcus gallinarum]|uniref:cysteine-rich KTR domain-containing protein n=1 Tax=Enterococcus gallinarum TaxID=1353 RepID=UPI0011DD3C86|nr:cysteine-rich KTR domain-containing protein [Enterococcus gallinarum]TXT68603.1 conjugal transfer protein [Enterococcus gallinarum]
MNHNTEWIFCPVCSNKTRVKIRTDTEARNFPLFCPKCKTEMVINIKSSKITIIKKPDA